MFRLLEAIFRLKIKDCINSTVPLKIFRSSVYYCTVEDVENVSIVKHSHHLVVVIMLP